MAEFERNLQKFDPEYADDDTNSNRHQGPTALGAPYWAWEGWDGETLPVQITLLVYTVKTNAWAEEDSPKGAYSSILSTAGLPLFRFPIRWQDNSRPY